MRGFAGGVDMGGARPSHADNRAYYAAKWGGYKGDETFVVPFNDPARGVDWWPTPPDPRSVIGLTGGLP